MASTGYWKADPEAPMVHLGALLLLLQACGSPDDERARSEPIPATKELGDPAGQGLKWGTLEGFVAAPAPAVPEALGGLDLGLPEADARAALERIHDPAEPRPQEVDLDGHRMIGASLTDYDEVAVTAIVDLGSGLVDQIDVSVPADPALYAFTDAWGPPTMVSDPKHGPVATWSNPETGLRVELYPSGPERAIAKLRRGSPR